MGIGRNGLGLTALVAIVCLAIGPAGASAQTPAEQQRAKALAKEAETLKKNKKLVEARAKYVEALRVAENAKYSGAIAQLDFEIGKLVEKRLDEAGKLFAGGKYPEALAALDSTLPLREFDPAVLYNRALILDKQGKRPEAIRCLDQAISSGVPDKEKMRLLQLRTQWETGEGQQKTVVEHQDALEDLNKDMASGEDTLAVCQRLKPLAGSLTRTASLVFNLAKCAEEEGKLEEAARLLEEYLQLSPVAADGDDTRLGVDEVRDIEKRAGPDVLRLYGEADRAARRGQYKRAIEALDKAKALRPEVPETSLRLARLHQGSDNLAAAQQHYAAYLAIENREPLLALARQEQEALEKRAAEYNALVGPMRARLQVWTRRYVLDGRPMGVEAAQEELRLIAQDLQRAAVMMPLAGDVNRMLGQIYLYDGNYPAARKAFTVVAEAGAPVWFYAVARDFDPVPKNTIVKVEVSGKATRLVGLARDDKKRRMQLLAAGADDGARMGGFLTPFEMPTDRKALLLDISTVSLVETDSDSLKVSWTEEAPKGGGKRREGILTPLRFTSLAPPAGAAARRFANTYAKLFRDFGDRKVTLGPEKMTGGEKFGMVMNIAFAAYAGGAAGMMSGMRGTAYAIASAMRSATWATMQLQKSLDAQARMLQESEFKIVPIEDVKPSFRKELFR